MPLWFILSLILYSLVSYAVPPDVPHDSEFVQLAHAKWWLRLMHYEKRTLGGYKSRADGLKFFVSKNGKYDPVDEIKASFHALRSGQFPEDHGFAKEHPYCMMPARFAYFQSVFPQYTKEWKKPSCPRLERFLETLNADSVSMVFSSYHLNSPASAFGHTLLRFRHAQKGKNDQTFELLDYAINFAANQHPNPLFNNIGGLTGYIPGTFAHVPYHIKVLEYNNVESRDLWNYELNLTPFEIDMLEKHFWEVGHSYFDYYYLFENCSYHMLTALEAAAPRLELTKHIPIYVIPVDTVKATMLEPGLVREIGFRPSKRRIFNQRLEHLSAHERNELKALLKELSLDSRLQTEYQEIKNEYSPDVLDAAIDFWDYEYFDRLLKKDPWVDSRKSAILRARAAHRSVTAKLPVTIPMEDAPHLGHGTARSFVGWSQSSPNQGLVLAHRFALHDLQDPSRSYTPWGEIEFLNTQVRVVRSNNEFENGRGPLRLDYFFPLAVRSLDPVDEFLPTRSFRLRMGAERQIDGSCEQCVPGILHGGYGRSYGFWKNRILVSGLLGVEAQLGQKLPVDAFRVGAGPELLVEGRFGRWTLSTSSWYRQWAFSQTPYSLVFDQRLRYSLSNVLSLSVQVQHSNAFWDVQSGLMIYL